jgi:hypothetical protein
MTLLQKQIRNAITTEGYIHIRVGRSSPATMNTIKSLKRANYRCARVGKQDDHDVWLISL